MHPPFFSSSFGFTAGAGFFVKTAKNGFGSSFWLTAVDALSSFWLITMYPPFFSSSFGSTAGAGFFVKTAKNGFGSPFWLTAVDALTQFQILI